MSSKLFGCELTGDGDQPKHVAARYGKISLYISVIVRLLVLRDCNVYRMLVGQPEGKRPLARPRRKREGSIKVGSRVVGWDGVDKIHGYRS